MKDKESTNGVLLAWFLFQYSLIIPLTNFVNASILVAVFSLSLITTLIIKNGLLISVKSCCFIIIMLIVLLLKVITGSELAVIVCFIVYAIPSGWAVSFSFNKEVFLVTACNIAVLNFILVCFYPFMTDYNYMRFGYGMLPSLLFLYQKIVGTVEQEHFSKWWNKRKSVDIILFLVGLLEIVFLGNRGALLSLLIYIAIDTFLLRKAFSIRNIVIIIGSFLVAYNITSILRMLRSLTDMLGVSGRTIEQLFLFVDEGFDAVSAGRDVLYSQAIERIKEHPIVGNDIVIDTDKLDYAHNLFLQVGQDLGFVGLFFLTILLVLIIYEIVSSSKERDTRIVISVLFSIAIGRLLFSSSIWLRPEFWMLVFLAINNIGSKYKIKKHSKSLRGS